MKPKISVSSAIFLAAVVLSNCGAAAASAQSAKPVAQPIRSAHVASRYGSTPLSFEPNQGQADQSVNFLSHGKNYTILLQPTVATLELNRDSMSPLQAEQARIQGKAVPATHEMVRMTLAGASPRAKMSAERALPGYVNYMIGSDRAKWKTGVPTYAATRVAQVYPGIDLVYYGTEKQLEYDFVVKPQVDPSQIHLALDGAKPVLEGNGDLRLQVAATRQNTDMVFRKPVLYQEVEGVRKPVEGSYSIAASGEVGFKVGSYDAGKELVIDPIISYASYFGGSGEDEINGSALNSSDELYAAGQTFSPSLPSGTGEFQSAGNAGNGGHDAFVTKFSADGSTILWSTFLEGSGDDFATGIAVNSSDQAYVVGYTNSCQGSGDPGSSSTSVRFPFTADAIQALCSPNVIGFDTYESNGGNYTTFLVKLSSDGKTELYGTPIGGSSGDVANSIVLDSAGRPYIVGQTTSTSYNKCATVGPHCSDVPSYPVDQHGNADIGLANYPTTSSAFYSNTTEAQLYPTVCTGCPGTQDEQAYITILSADLHSFVYSSLIGGPHIGGCGNGACNTNGIAVAVNGVGQAFIGGNTSSAYWPTTAGSFSPTCSHSSATNSQCPMVGWLAGFDPTKTGASSLLFSTYMTGSSAGIDGNGNALFPGGDVFGIATDSEGNVVVTGDNSANNFPTTTGAFEPTCMEFGDGNGNSKRCASAFVTKFFPTGTTVWSTYYTPMTGPGNFVIGQGVALDKNDDVFVVGTSTSPTLPLGTTLTTNSAQNDDAFIIELSPTGSSLLMGSYLGTGGGINLNNNSLHLDSDLNAYFTGSQGNNPYGGTFFPVSANAPGKTIGGSTDGWVAKLITQQQPTATTLAVSPTGTATPTQTITLTATVSSTSTLTGIPTAPSGSVSFMNGSTVLGTGSITGSTAAYSGTLASGSYSITAVYAGDTGFDTSTSPASTLVISSASSTATTLTVNPATSILGTKVTLTASTMAGSAPVTGGTVTFTAGAGTLGTATVGSNGVASTTVTPAVGVYSVIANYTGTASASNPTGTGSSVSAGVALIVSKATPTVTLTVTPTLAATGSAVKFSAAVSSAAGTPSGQVSFYNGSALLGSGTLSNGVATYTASSLAAATYTITAAYSGDTSFVTVTSSSVSLVVRAPAATTTTLTSSSLTASAKSSITLNATVSSTVNTGSPSGTVTFNEGSTSLGSGALSNGVTALSLSTLSVGTHTITATYAGDGLFLGSTSPSISEVIVTPTLTLAATPNPLTIARGKSGTTTITLTPNNGFTGAVTFSCAGLPKYASCSFAPTSITFASSSAAMTDVLTISTVQGMASLDLPSLRRAESDLSFAGILLPSALLGLLGLARVKRTTSLMKRTLLMVLILGSGLASTVLTGCGSSVPTAAAGTYQASVIVTAADGTTQALSLPITIQ
jgi:hypothetical protein